MDVGQAFQMCGEIYVVGIAISLGMAGLIKLIVVVIGRSERKSRKKAQLPENEGGAA